MTVKSKQKPKKIVYQTLEKFGVDVSAVLPTVKISRIFDDPELRVRFAKALTDAADAKQPFSSSKLSHSTIRDVVVSVSALPGDVSVSALPGDVKKPGNPR